MKKLALTAGACVALAVPVVAGVAGAQEGPDEVIEFHQLARDVRSGFVDAPPRRRESPGDSFTVSGALRASDGRRAGTAHAVFVQTARRGAQGSATFALHGGSVMVTGALLGSGTDTLAISGGTGAYTGVSGTAKLRERRDRTEFVLTVAR